MEPKIEQLELHTLQQYLFSITPKLIEEMDEDCAVYTVVIYEKKKVRGISNFRVAKNIGEFEIIYMGDGDMFFSKLREGIEKRIDTNNIVNLNKEK